MIKGKDKFLMKRIFTMPFLFLLVEIQKEKKIFIKDSFKILHYFTDGIVKSLEIVEKWAEWTKWTIQIQTPSWPKDFKIYFNGTAVIIYLVTLHHWFFAQEKPISKCEFMIYMFWWIRFCNYPSLLSKISRITTNDLKKCSTFYIYSFTVFYRSVWKNDVYYLKDIWSIPKSFNTQSNILSYKSILEWLSDDTTNLLNKQNSELFVEWYIDDLFLNISKMDNILIVLLEVESLKLVLYNDYLSVLYKAIVNNKHLMNIKFILYYCTSTIMIGA